MADTVRTQSALQDLCAANSTGAITSQTLRDLIVSSVSPYTTQQIYSINGIATTSTDAILLQNTTAGTSGIPNQYAPRIHYSTNAWNSTATVSQAFDIITEVRPQSQAGSPSGTFVIAGASNGGSFNDMFSVSLGGAGTFAGGLTIGATSSLTFTGRSVLAAPAGRTFKFGTDGSTASLSQTLSIGNITGVADTAAGNLVIQGGVGTGTGAGGSIVFQTAAASGSSSSTQNSLATVLTLASDLSAVFTGTLNVTGISTFISRITTSVSSVNGAITLTGAIATSGTSTTNLPAIFLQPSGTTTVTTWTTNGTGLGMNLASGFSGNFLDFHVNGGSSLFSVNFGGAVSTVSSIAAGGTLTAQRAPINSTSAFSLIGTLLTGGTATTNLPHQLFQSSSATAVTTWSTSGTYIGVNTDSGFAGNFLDFHINGGSSVHNLQSTGAWKLGGVTADSSGNITFTNTNTQIIGTSTLTFGTPGVSYVAAVQNGGLIVKSDKVIGWGSSVSYGGYDCIMTRAGTANIRLGNADAVSPVAQTLSMQSVLTGTSNTAGQDFTIVASSPTGSAEPGKIILSFYGNGSSGSTTPTNNYQWQFTRSSLNGPTNCTFSNGGAYSMLLNGSACTYTATANNNAFCHLFVSGNQSQSNGSLHEDWKHTSTFNPTAGSSPFYGMSLNYTINQTGSASGDYTALYMNVVETAVTGTNKLLMDLQVGGSSKFNVTNSGSHTSQINNFAATSTDGAVYQNTTAATVGTQFQWSPRLRLTGQGWSTGSTASQQVDAIIESQIVSGGSVPGCNLALSYQVNGGGYTRWFYFSNNGIFNIASGGFLQFGGTGLISSGGSSMIRIVPGTGVIQLGNSDAASPVAQTLQVQSVVAGTTDTAGQNFTIKGSAGTGTGAGGNIVFQTASTGGSTGTSQNSFVTSYVITSTKHSFYTAGVERVRIDGGFLSMGANQLAAGTSAANADVYLSRAAAANWQLGRADVASPIAQTLSVQSVVAGTSSASGADFIIRGSLSTGTGTSGNILLKNSFTGVAVSAQTVTISIANPGVVTLNGHGLLPGQAVQFATDGALPTGLTAGTTYYVTSTMGGNTFRIATTVNGSAINTSGTQSGNHTVSTVATTQNPEWNHITFGPGANGGGQSTTALSITPFWNNLTGLPTALLINPSTGGANSSMGMIDVKLGGTQVWKLTADGIVAMTSNLNMAASTTIQWNGQGSLTSDSFGNVSASGGLISNGGNIRASAASNIGWNGRGQLSSDSSSNIVASGCLIANATSIGTTSTDGIVIQNTTAAAVGAQQYSPRSRWRGFGWKTASTAASQSVDFAAEVRPVQGSAAPTGSWVLSSAINGGSYTDSVSIDSNGNIGFGPSFLSYIGPISTYGAQINCYNQNGYYVGLIGAVGAFIGAGRSNGATIGFSSTQLQNGIDLWVTRKGAANLQLGSDDAASPIAQTLSVQSVITGTSNTAGADWIRQSSLPSGNGISGLIYEKTAIQGPGATSNTVTMTIATPCVISLTAHGFCAGQPVVFTTTGALPTGITSGTTYYVSFNGANANSFRICTTPWGSSDVATSGSQSGTHTCTTSATVQQPACPVVTIGPSGSSSGQSQPALWIRQAINNASFQDVVKISTYGTSGHNPLDIVVNGTSVFYVQNNGNIIASGDSYHVWNGRGAILMPANGVAVFTNSGNTNMGRLVLGTNDTSGVALTKSTTNLSLTLGDGTGNAGLTVGSLTIATSGTPSSSSDTGTTGQIKWDSSYIYVCTATNTWARAAISTW